MVTAANEQQPATMGEALAQELRWVHGKIRHDLETIQHLAEGVLAGAPPAQIRAEIAAMQTNSPLWKLRVNCLYYCRVVHLHHRIEDRQLFPALRQSNPALGPVVDKLEADHARVSNHLDGVEAAADGLVDDDTADRRRLLVDALRELAEQLLAHLAFEEEAIIPTMERWDRWPRVEGESVTRPVERRDAPSIAGHHDEEACARAWVALHSAHALVSECLSTALARCCGLTISDFEVLVRLLSAEPRTLRVTDLNDAVALSQPALSRLVARLEQQGLVQRAAAPDDKRAFLLALTSEGHAVLRRAMPVHAACVRDVLTSRLTDAEQHDLVESLSRVSREP